MGELGSDYVPTKMASLRWIYMLLEKVPAEMNKYIEKVRERERETPRSLSKKNHKY